MPDVLYVNGACAECGYRGRVGVHAGEELWVDWRNGHGTTIRLGAPPLPRCPRCGRCPDEARRILRRWRWLVRWIPWRHYGLSVDWYAWPARATAVLTRSRRDGTLLVCGMITFAPDETEAPCTD